MCPGGGPRGGGGLVVCYPLGGGVCAGLGLAILSLKVALGFFCLFVSVWVQNLPQLCACMQSFLSFLIYVLIGGKLIYNVVLVSAVQQCESVIIICIHSLSFEPPLPFPVSTL